MDNVKHFKKPKIKVFNENGKLGSPLSALPLYEA